MSDRDELALAIAAHLDRLFGVRDFGPATQDRKLADALIADGYSKPRTVTTVEELDALPVGAVVLHHGRAFQHYPAYPAPFDEYQKWKCGDGGFVRSTKDGSAILPAVVLYEPEAAK